MFVYCTERLHLSEAEAYLRIRVARASRKHPTLLPMLEDGRLHLSGIAKLAPVPTEANCDELLARAAHKSKWKIEELVAEIAPKPDVASRMRKLPAKREPSKPAPGVALRPDAVENPAPVVELRPDAVEAPAPVEPRPAPVKPAVVRATYHRRLGLGALDARTSSRRPCLLLPDLSHRHPPRATRFFSGNCDRYPNRSGDYPELLPAHRTHQDTGLAVLHGVFDVPARWDRTRRLQARLGR